MSWVASSLGEVEEWDSLVGELCTSLENNLHCTRDSLVAPAEFPPTSVSLMKDCMSSSRIGVLANAGRRTESEKRVRSKERTAIGLADKKRREMLSTMKLHRAHGFI